MKALITGCGGFVGGYLWRELEENGYDVVGLDVAGSERVIAADILDPDQMNSVIAEVRPQVVFHLAGQANVAASWKFPQKTMAVNVIGSINLMEAVRRNVPDARIVIVGSSDEYGRLGEAGANVSEEQPVDPQTPYAVSKATQESMAQLYFRAYGMNVCMTRSFNHAGRGQKRGFMLPDFAYGVVCVERGEAECVRVGNLSAKRDFTHVRDVVRAYRLIAEKGVAGSVYNVGSGYSISAQAVLDSMIAKARCPIPVCVDPDRIRPIDTPVICCDHRRLTRDTGWEAQIGMDEIIDEVLTEWRNQPKGL